MTLGGCAPMHDIALSPGEAQQPAPSAAPEETAAQQALVDAIAARLIAGEEVAAYKAANHLAISDPAREAEVVAAAAASAAEHGVDEDLARGVVTDQIAASKIVQEGFQRLWAAGAPAPASPSLDRARGVISSATATIVTELAAGPICPTPAALARLSDELQRLGLDRKDSDSAAQRATASLCA
ncbi:gamma subclass chorismate mutase AroQ [Agromyces silvae]|uniref:gamma subclass chorismate mutase AroQ n=1 Tax=Agromyces silvae TaxID=3388266 RepID=UPI00280B25E2|nr:gamma subclass chorismate mutase AroQ [Agromyces protaetiae]